MYLFFQDIPCFGSAEVADIRLENDAYIYFKPTCLGTESKTFYTISNPSRLPMAFKWNINSEELDTLSIEPPDGVILPGEEQVKN